MARSTLAISLAVFVGSGLGCSFVDDFDKFHAADTIGQGDDAGTTNNNDSATASDASKPANDAAMIDAAKPVLDSSVADSSVDAAPVDAYVPPPACGNVVCDDGDACTRDTCDGTKCVFTVLDADGDGYSPGTCKTGSSAKGGDCDDTNKDVHPGAKEVCDGVDNNCDGKVDEGVSTLVCYPDLDQDSFGNLDGKPVGGCGKCPEFTVAVTDASDRSKHDCWDDPKTRGAFVYPGTRDWQEEGYGPGGKSEKLWDYNCNGKTDQETGELVGACGLLGLLCSGERGFVRDSNQPANVPVVPACGESGKVQQCGMNGLDCSGTTSTAKQRCN